MHRYLRQIYFGNPMLILGGSTLSVISGLIAQTIFSDNDLTKSLVLISTLVGVIGGIVTAIGGILVSLERIRVENLRVSYTQMLENRDFRDQVALLRRMMAEGHVEASSSSKQSS